MEKVIAKKWGVDCDAEYWADGTLKERFKVTFSEGRKYDREDYQAIDSKAEGDLRRELEEKEMICRRNFAGGQFPHEIAERQRQRELLRKPNFKKNFKKLENKQQMADGTVIKLLSALPEVVDAKSSTAASAGGEDFECVPFRPGATEFVANQKFKIARAQQRWRARNEARAAWAHENKAFEDAPETYNNDRGAEIEEEGTLTAELDQGSLISAQTSVTVMKSEVSLGPTGAGEGVGG